MTAPVRRPGKVLIAWLLAITMFAPGLAFAEHPLKIEPLDIVTHTGIRHFKVEMANTDASRERGLMFRKSLAGDRGMLFDFFKPQNVSFWMKNTLIPLDLLFIGADGRIISITHNAVPLSEAMIPSGGPALGVLEIRGGRADEIGAAPGDLVRQRMFRH